MSRERLRAFIDDVGAVVGSTDDEHELTGRIAELLSALLAGGYRLPPPLTRAAAQRHLTYPIHIAPDESWSMASVVWAVGQQTNVHSHETWGAVGIYAGAELEVRYAKPTADSPCGPLTPAGRQRWDRGQVTVCCTTDDDVHSVVAVGDEPTIGIHVYGGNIGTIKRRAYDPATGETHWFTSGWDDPEDTATTGHDR
jgi:3-mercaptopropionate dioxygenase